MIQLSDECLSNLDENLEAQTYNLSRLSYLQKIILGTDGTVTQLLESIVGEQIVVEKLLEADVSVLPHEEDMHCQQRVITLNGGKTGLPYLYADSLVYHGNMNVNFSRALTETRIPIGKAWEKFQIETYKTLLSWGFEYAGDLSHHFAVEPCDLVLYRTYLVYSQGKKIFRITEKFPFAWYMQSEQFDAQFASAELSTLVSGI
ncbi:chorismate pyruvate-lyase family protein [Pseudoalteromonas sp. SMS1]|uniref:chorismate--pyruvate lyase family protein n=1 Tax=Pseudoalteromonas sp. SMS1 TaxID=2908894 RepID=UPI001F2F918B|nr:chorismate pyruvate-lyase family protein [Pseudoalteromonas sp. SMS1]MCF2860291.1 chorismate pyruvate-lyase family protein [Pseudoalteromonas sp. SMS1]